MPFLNEAILSHRLRSRFGLMWVELQSQLRKKDGRIGPQPQYDFENCGSRLAVATPTNAEAACNCSSAALMSGRCSITG